MSSRKELCTFNRYEWHKGFYNDGDPTKSLLNINYSDFLEAPYDDGFPYDTAFDLLCGSCHHFAVSLKKVLDYDPYIIEGKKGKGFHAFCQIYKTGTWYYVDVRGITSSFSEFMDIAKMFVTNEYIIRPVNSKDIDEWERDSDYNKEAYAFAEAVINKYKECYIPR